MISLLRRVLAILTCSAILAPVTVHGMDLERLNSLYTSPAVTIRDSGDATMSVRVRGRGMDIRRISRRTLQEKKDKEGKRREQRYRSR